MVARSLTLEEKTASRAEALLARVDAGVVEVREDAELEGLLSTVGERATLPRGGVEGRGREKSLVVLARLGEGSPFPGYAFDELRDGRRERARHGVLCHSAIEVQSAVGCPFDCTYCPYTAFVCAHLDVESIVERVTRVALERPAQRLFKLNNRTDTLGLEPELGLAPALVERFAELGGDRQLMLYSKGDAVDGLVDLDHGGRTIASFTLTPEPVAALLEAGAPSPQERLRAIGRLARAGYPIRVRFSPIVPLRGWLDAYRSLVARLVREAVPEMVTLWTLSMIELDEVERIVPLQALDPDVLEASRAAAPRMRGDKGAPFPPEVRADLYRELAALVREASPTTEVALCLERAEVWSGAEGPLTSRRGAKFLCNCGPTTTSDALVRLRARR